MDKKADFLIDNELYTYEETFNAVYKEKTGSVFSYFEYLPGNYKRNGQMFPLILFLHGAGEVGDSRSNHSVLTRVLKHGIPFMIKKNLWKPSHPYIVISPQNEVYGWDPDDIHSFISYIKDNYNIDERRIYMTGISMGGFGIFSYLCKYGDQSRVAAAIPICGGGDIKCAQNLKDIPIWAFHGDADNVVNVRYSIDIINAINKLNPSAKAKLTVFPKVKHNSWTITYNGAGRGKESSRYDKFDMLIWDWMYQHKR